MALEAHPFYMIGRHHELLATSELAGQTFDRQFRNIVVLVGKVAHGPEQAAGNWLRLRLGAQLGPPFFP